jgi:hypothetical protein
MLKNAAALTAVALGAASPASAHYKGYYNFSLYAGFELPLRDASSHAEDLGPRTATATTSRPSIVTSGSATSGSCEPEGRSSCLG